MSTVDHRSVMVYSGEEHIGRVIEHDTDGYQLSALPPCHWTAERPDGTNLGRVFWSAGDAAKALHTDHNNRSRA